MVKNFEEKYQNNHLNDTFSLKIANISLQKQNFPGIWSKISSTNCNFLQIFRYFCKKIIKDQDIHLNDTFSLKIAKISLKK